MRDTYLLPALIFVSLGAALTSEIGIWLFAASLALTALEMLSALFCE